MACYKIHIVDWFMTSLNSFRLIALLLKCNKPLAILLKNKRIERPIKMFYIAMGCRFPLFYKLAPTAP
jgi:hypothetical protein